MGERREILALHFTGETEAIRESAVPDAGTFARVVVLAPAFAMVVGL